ncbi:hypothetical protein PMAYCL1PPCAC_08751, partial [Pristionchus mayeri]
QTSTKRKIPLLRYVIVMVGTLTTAFGISCGYAYNFAVVCNVDQGTDAKGIYEKSPSNSPVMYFNTNMTNLIYSALPAGTILGLFILIALSNRVSVRTQVIFGTAISTLSTALIPIAFDVWPTSTLVLKIIQGAATAPTIPLVGHIAGHWTPMTEIGLFVAILTSNSQIGLFVTMSSAGPLCDRFGWRSIFYFNAACSAFALLLCCLFFYDTPHQHGRLSEEEFTIISPNRKTEVKEKPRVPFRAFFTHSSVWAVLIAAIGNFNGISPLIVFSAAILKKAVGVTDMEAATYNGVSFLMQLVFKMASGILSDRWTSVSETFKTGFFNTISSGLAGVLMIATAFLPAENKVLCASFITLTQAVIGFNAAGYNRAAMIVTRQYAHFLVTLIGVIIATSTIAEPFLVMVVAPETTWNQWFFLFILHGAILAISNVIFCVLIRAEPAKFTETKPMSQLEDGEKQ